jgi:hypothetical protein
VLLPRGGPDPERLGKIVGSAERNDPDWQARLKQPGQRRVQCAVAPADDHAFDLTLRGTDQV